MHRGNAVTPENQALPRDAKQPELTTPYRPLGLKAVAAAALMLQRKPAKTAA